MKSSKRKFILVYSISLILITLSIFFNVTKTINHEITYDPSEAIPLSSLLNARYATGSITIEVGQVVYIDRSLNFERLTIKGQLHCDHIRADNEIELKVKSISIMGGVFQCGRTSNTYKKKLIISLKHSGGSNPHTDHLYRGIVVMGNGKLILNGDTRKAGWFKLNRTAVPGENFIILNNKLRSKYSKRLATTIGLDWEVGDEIAIGPTSFDYKEAESFKIIAFDRQNPYKIYLDKPFQYTHWGQQQTFNSNSMGAYTLDERAEVANLTRSILIRADESITPISDADIPGAQLGGHVMAHHGAFAAINGVEFSRMGQAGIMARYPFHWHIVGDAPGQFIKNSSIHKSFQRCITVHRTNKVLLQNNVCYNFKGHGLFLEDGTEVNNRIIKNLAMMAKPPSPSKILLASDNIDTGDKQGRNPSVSGIWISNPDNIVKHNTVSGSVGSGIWMSFENVIKDLAGVEVVARPISTDTKEFSHNRAHASLVGITWDGAQTGPLTNNPNNPNDRELRSAHYAPQTVPTFNNLVAYKNLHTGIYFRGQTAVFENSVTADNGWSYWYGYNQIIKDSIIIGETNNKSLEIDHYFFNNAYGSRHRKTGIVLYDGPFEVHDTDFLGFSTEASEYTLDNGTISNSTTVPFTSTGGSRKLINYTSGLRFDPEPVYRAHLLDPDGSARNKKARSYLGNSFLKDLDGTLTGSAPGSSITGYRSLGIMQDSYCSSGNSSFHNFVVCPPNYTEGSFVFMRWGGSRSPWSSTFAVIRNDDALSYPKDEWNYIQYIPNNKFATANSKEYSYELLPKYDYEYDRLDGVNLRVNANTEIQNAENPVVKIVAYGNNCHLGEDAQRVYNLKSLKNATVSSYYSNNQDFYVKLVPDKPWRMMAYHPYQQAQSFDTYPKYPVTCDEGHIEHKVTGLIESVHSQRGTTTIKGWACNVRKSSSIQVKLYLKKATSNQKGNEKLATSLPIFIAQQYSNKVSEARISFNCGSLSQAGRRFEFIVPTATLDQYPNHEIYVQGISNSGGANLYISGSGVYNTN